MAAAVVEKESMNIVIVGHVDHGKSTVIGRLLADTNSLPEGKLEAVKKECLANSKPFEYAFLIDALEDEQSQGITIDAARVFFQTEKRNYIIIDAPGHIEFLKNMITGASRAEAALLVIDANEGIQENSRRHGYMLAMLGISKVTVLINKFDLVKYDEKVFNQIKKDFTAFLNEVGLSNFSFIPVSGREGDNLASLSENTPWYKGQTVLETLDLFPRQESSTELPLRLPIQDVYKFTRFSDDRRLYVGTIDTGTLKTGDKVVFFPSGKKSSIKSIEVFNGENLSKAQAGMATAVTLSEQIYIKRGELLTRDDENRPRVTTRIKTSIFWLGNNPMVVNKDYLLKTGSAKVVARLEEIHRVIDASDLQAASKQKIERHDVADCTLVLAKPIACDLADEVALTSRFVIVDQYEITGGGIIREALADKQQTFRENVLMRNYHWERSLISNVERAGRYCQRPTLLLITGEIDVGRKDFAKRVEQRLFHDGKKVYFLGLGNVIHGLDADLEEKKNNRDEHIRRMAEVAFILLDAGFILVTTAPFLGQEDLELIKTSVQSDRIETIWVGEEITTDIHCELHIENPENWQSEVGRVVNLLEDKGIIFRPS